MAGRKSFGKAADDMEAPVSEKIAAPVATSADRVRECAAALRDAVGVAVSDGYSVSMAFSTNDLDRIVISETGKVKR